MTRAHAVTALLLLGLLGCALGGSVERWKPSGQAAGSDIELFLRDGRSVRGELLAIDSAGFLVLEPARMVRVEAAAARSGAAFKTGFDLPLSKETRDRLRLMSRYPQGVPAAVEQALLAAYGWKRVEVEAGSASP
ncbi:MAG: hypothetical protein U0133_08340 [Gemmatimonadales bacterium]